MGIKSASLSDVLFTKTRQRVLGLLYVNAGEQYHVNEILRASNMGVGTVQRELKKLAEAGLVEVTQVGNQKHYQANAASSVFAELRGLVVKTVGVADKIRNALSPINNKIDLAFIFGSIAEGTDKAGSDVDLLLVGNRLSYITLMKALGKVDRHLGRTINPVLYKKPELTEKLKGGNAFAKRVMERPKIFIKGTTDDLTQFSQSRKKGGANLVLARAANCR